MRKYIIIFSIFLSCTRFIPLQPTTKFSLPICEQTNCIKILQSENFLFEIPSEYFIKKSYLYISDSINYRILKINKKNEILLNITSKTQNISDEIFSLPLKNNENLFKTFQPGKIVIDNNENIFVENMLASVDEEHQDIYYSIILKFDESGKPLKIIGSKISNNLIFPFNSIDKFSFDKENNLFVIEKKENNWNVYKFNENNELITNISFNLILDKIKISTNNKIIIENLDHTADGNYLIAGINFYENDFKFLRTEFWKIGFNFEMKKIFTIKDENLSFVLVNNSDLIYLVKTESSSKEEKIIFEIFNLKGRRVANKIIKIKIEDGKWFDTKIQKDNLITSIKIENNQFNIIEWK